MSSNYSFNIDTENKTNLNKIDTYKDPIKKVFKIKKDVHSLKKINSHHKNSKQLNNIQNKKTLIDLDQSYSNSLILLNIIKNKMKENVFEKYNNINENNKKNIQHYDNKIEKNILMKKKFLKHSLQTFYIIN